MSEWDPGDELYEHSGTWVRPIFQEIGGSEGGHSVLPGESEECYCTPAGSGAVWSSIMKQEDEEIWNRLESFHLVGYWTMPLILEEVNVVSS